MENSSGVQWKTSDLKAMFNGTLHGTYKHILEALQCVCSPNDGHALPEDSQGNITESVKRFVVLTEDLQLDVICDDLTKMVNVAVSCVNFVLNFFFLVFYFMLKYWISIQGDLVTCDGSENPNLCTDLGAHLKHIYSLLEPLQIFSEGLLDDFLVIHRSVCFFFNISEFGLGLNFRLSNTFLMSAS